MRQAWEQYVRRRIDIHVVVERMKRIVNVDDADAEGEKDIPSNSFVSVTTATAAESDHDDDDAARSNKGEKNRAHTDGSKGDDIAKSTPNQSNGRKKVVEKNESFELIPGEDDMRSIQSLIVDIDGTSRHSGISGPSGATVSGSEQTTSSRWDDSINTASVGGIGADSSLSTVVFEEYLRPRQQRVGSIQISGDAPPSPLSTSDIASCGTSTTPPPSGLAPPSLTKPKNTALRKNQTDITGPRQTLLHRIASCSLDEDAADEHDVSLQPATPNS